MSLNNQSSGIEGPTMDPSIWILIQIKRVKFDWENESKAAP